MKQIDVLEYEWIGPNERVTLTDSQLSLLDKATYSLPGNTIQWQRNRFRFNGYCGVLQLGDLTLEILPKIHGTERQPGQSRQILIKMLSAIQKLDLHSSDTANLNIQKHVLLDVFILSFAEQLQNLLRGGMHHTYVQQKENLQVVKGKIDVTMQLKHNLCHQHKTYCQYDEFVTDNLQNQIIKTTLKYLSRFARSNRVLQLLESLCGVFVEVSDLFPTSSDWAKLKFNRTNENWQDILIQCKWFLNGMSPDVISGNEQSISLLFSMNILFEEYITIELKKAFSKQYEVLAQKPQKKLLKHSDGSQIFVMKPDIYVRGKSTHESIAILDTKWKLLKGEERKMGVSQSDLYQMYTYAGSYDVDKVMLLYPKQYGLESLKSQWMFSDDSKTLEIIQIDLEVLLKGRRALRNHLTEILESKLTFSPIIYVNSE